MTRFDDFIAQYGPLDPDDPQIHAALVELTEMISQRFPATTYTVTIRDDLLGVRLTPIVSVDEFDDVIDVFIERLVELQVEERLSIYVVPDLTPEGLKVRLREMEKAHDYGFPRC